MNPNIVITNNSPRDILMDCVYDYEYNTWRLKVDLKKDKRKKK